MPSDRARYTFDPSRMYRSVVSQQGRVTLDADDNEAEEIRSEGTRVQLVDVVGPTGSPDEGFKIGWKANIGPDFLIGAGTLYAGGLRVQNDEQTASYLNQKNTEWLLLEYANVMKSV